MASTEAPEGVRSAAQVPAAPLVTNAEAKGAETGGTGTGGAAAAVAAAAAGGKVEEAEPAAAPRGGHAHSIAVPDSVKKDIRAMKIKHKHGFVTLEIDESLMALRTVKLGRKNATFDDFLKALPSKRCLFAVYEHGFVTADGRPSSKAYFVIWNPRRAASRHKVLYTTHKRDVITAVGQLGLVVADSEDDLRREMKIPAQADSDSDTDSSE